MSTNHKGRSHWNPLPLSDADLLQRGGFTVFFKVEAERLLKIKLATDFEHAACQNA